MKIWTRASIYQHENINYSLTKLLQLPGNYLPQVIIVLKISVINPFMANVPVLYTLKTPENLWFSGVFREYKMEILARIGLTDFMPLVFWSF